MTDHDVVSDQAHEDLIERITTGRKKKKVGRAGGSVHINELLNSIKSTKSVAKVKKVATSKKKKDTSASKTLKIALFRGETEKIQRAVGYNELVKDLETWEPVVNEHKTAEHLSFPLNKDDFRLETAANRYDGLVPRTALESAMSHILANSKNNLKNNSELTQAEMELVKAMDETEAKEKLAQLKKMRALQGVMEQKFRRQKHIKSKNYHRIMKRAKRRQQLKEFDELLLRDPEAAKAKLQEMDRDRIVERATLKHTSQNKMSKVLAKHAARDPNARKLMEDHIRFGREMKEKVGMESGEESASEEEEENDEQSSLRAIINEAELTADMEELNEQKCKEKLTRMRAERKKKEAKELRRGAGEETAQKEHSGDRIEKSQELPQEVNAVEESSKEEREKAVEVRKKKGKKRKERDVKEKEEEEDVNVEDLFNRVQQKIDKKLLGAKEEEQNKRKGKKVEDEMVVKKKKAKKSEEKEESGRREDDLMLDPNNYLKVESASLTQAGTNLEDSEDVMEEGPSSTLNEAFVDDDVVEEFAEEKEEREEMEREKDIDLTLLGWGEWTGPGIKEKKKKMIVKANEVRRRDNGRLGVIIREKKDELIGKLQPKSVPFPFTSMQDFEASMGTPIGREWNCLSTHRELVRKSVSTQGGRVIQPMSRAHLLKSAHTK